jgi:hypothetical protein
MTSLRNILLVGGLLALSACATQTFKPDKAPEYGITRDFTPFYKQRPVPGANTDISLKAKTRVKLLRTGTEYSFVLLEDSRTGYVANKNMSITPPGTFKKPFGSADDESTKPRRKRRSVAAAAAGASPTPSPSSVSQIEQTSEKPSASESAPAPTPNATPVESPKPPPNPAPTPQVPLEKPKFRL